LDRGLRKLPQIAFLRQRLYRRSFAVSAVQRALEFFFRLGFAWDLGFPFGAQRDTALGLGDNCQRYV
jgi:hypothetical protein